MNAKLKILFLLPIWWCFSVCIPIFVQAQTLPTPVLFSPANNATGQPSTLYIKWHAVPGANQYKVSVSTPNHSNDIAWDSTYTDTTFLLSNLPNGTYLWRIKAKHDIPYANSDWTTAWTFTVGSSGGGGNQGGGGDPGGGTTLAKPSLISPSNASTFQILGTNLLWYSVPGATRYKVKVATDAQMSNLVFQDTTVTATSRIPNNLAYNTQYYWTVQACNASSQGPPSAANTFTTMPDNPNAVTSHPRLWVTQANLPTLRSWANTNNPVFTAMQTALNSAIATYNSQFFPGGQPNPNWPDNGGTTWSGYVTEMYAEYFAFWSLIDPVVANRPQHAQRARNLLMYVIDQAYLGPAAGVPFRDPQFMTYDRSRIYGEAFGLTVDWIYNAKNANNADILTAADKAKIRTVFMRWCNDQLTAYNHPNPIGLVNDKQMLTSRWVLNNYYSGHARNMTLMSLSMDAGDDPTVDPNIPFSALGNSLRSYIYNATGAWLYLQYSQYELPNIVAADYGISPNYPNLSSGSGGLPAEGSLYGESLGFVSGGLLALKTAGWADENIIGKQAKLISSAYWTRFMDGLMSSITPAAKTWSQMSYLGPVYQVACYGDLLRTWVTPDYVNVTGNIGLIAQLNGDQSLLDKTRWCSRNVLQGGAGYLSSRISNIWGGSNASDPIMYFMLLNPNGSTPPDPRPSLPTTFYDRSLQRILSRTDWTAGATWFDWHCHWTTINHQSGDANQFELFRNGEWLIKERSGYTNDGIGYTSEFHNTLGLQNNVPGNLQWFEGATSLRGGQWTNGMSNGDPTSITSVGNNFVYATGDATNLYNRGSSASDIVYAVRSIVWLKPDHIIVYDRAKSKTANRFKRFFLQFTAPAVVNGKNVTVSTPGGQKVFLSNLLPSTSVLTPSVSENLNSLAMLEPTTNELKIEDPVNPLNIRFLNVIQGANGNGVKDSVTYISSSAGTAFDGAFVINTAVMFPNVWGAAFDSTVYTVPATVTRQLVTGLTPGAAYDVNATTNGNNVIIKVKPGTQLTADAGGVLLIGNISFASHPESLAAAPSKLTLESAPNPFSDYTSIRYELPEASAVTLKVFDISGKQVSILADNELQEAGEHSLIFDGNGLAPGMYICQLIAGNERSNIRLMINR